MIEEKNPFSLKDKTILVTGASSGIGRAIAIECSKMGATLVLTGRNMERLKETLSVLRPDTSHKLFAIDLTDFESIKDWVSKLPLLDGIVHCAGVGERMLLNAINPHKVSRIMKINFEAPTILQNYILQHKKINKGGSIIFIASRAPYAPTIGNGIYAASKGALLSYAKVLGLELANRKIRVNSICPAMVWTELIAKDGEINGIDYHEEEKKYPLKRFGRPEDIAYLAVYLLSDASEWMTGSVLDITGGGEFTLKG